MNIFVEPVTVSRTVRTTLTLVSPPANTQYFEFRPQALSTLTTTSTFEALKNVK